MCTIHNTKHAYKMFYIYARTSMYAWIYNVQFTMYIEVSTKTHYFFGHCTADYCNAHRKICLGFRFYMNPIVFFCWTSTRIYRSRYSFTCSSLSSVICRTSTRIYRSRYLYHPICTQCVSSTTVDCLNTCD